jgi:hypothetical protein
MASQKVHLLHNAKPSSWRRTHNYAFLKALHIELFALPSIFGDG